MKLELLFAVILVLIDSVWLFGASDLHQDMAQRVQGKPLKAKLTWAAAFYVLGVIAFTKVILPLSTVAGKLDDSKVFMYGSLLGLLMYGTFDMTNKAIFTDYPTKYALYDTAWGTFALGLASFLTVKTAKYMALL